jgi:ribose transport system substrate-binding protein
MRRGAGAAAQRAGYRLYWNAPTREDDVDRQILIAEAAVHRGARALILGPTNPRGLTTMLNELERRRLPVVTVQTEPPMPPGGYLTSVTPDQTEFGILAAERVVQITRGAGQVAVLGLDRGAPESLVRAKSFVQALASHSGIQVVRQSEGSVQTLEAEQNARAVIHSFPNLRVIFAVSAEATQGAVLALEEEKRKSEISLVGCDRDLFLRDDLMRGKIDSLVGVDAYRVGYLAMQTALIGAGGQPLPAPQHVKVTLFTRDNVDMFDKHQEAN